MNGSGLKNYSLRLLLCSGLLLLAAGCATPTSPTGGEPDKEGPSIIEMEPETGTTNFEGSKIELSFSEFVERSSLRKAVSIEPDIGVGYSLNWGRKSVAIEFDNELPELTTVIVNIGTDLTDTRNNKMAEPVRIAVSTGPEIDQGKIAGRIVDARTGKGTSGDRVFLYREPFDLEKKANYIAETDTSGKFLFSYLRQGNYKVFWVNDQNRSKIWERSRERAQPFARETVQLEKEGSDTLKTLYKSRSDTTSPTLQGVGQFSRRRLRLRFSENIQLTDSIRLIVNDTLGNRFAPAVPLYVKSEEPYVLFARSEKGLEAGNSFELEAHNVPDAAGNVTRLTSYRFDGSSQEDTTRQRIIKQRHPAGLFPNEPLEIVYATFIDDPTVMDSVLVVQGDQMAESWPSIAIEQNRLLVKPQDKWEQGLDYEVRIWNTLSQNRKSYKLNVWHPPDFGAIQFSIADTTDRQEYRLNLITKERGQVVDTTFTGSVEVERLPPLEYQGIIYTDLDGDGRWSPGQVDPYKEPEPYFIQNKIPVKKGFTSEVTVPLR